MKRYKAKNISIVFISLILSLLLTGCNIGKQEVDISKYHIETDNISKYLQQQKQIVVYNPTTKILRKITFDKTADNKLLKYSRSIFPIESEFYFSPQGIKYFHKLHSVGCDMNIIKCLNKKIKSNNNYIFQNNSKSYILENYFGETIFDTIENYKKYLDYLDQLE